MLHPGTLVPHPNTTSKDIKYLYVELSNAVCDYFKVRILVPILCDLKALNPLEMRSITSCNN